MSSTLSAQPKLPDGVTHLEYFIDSDPGYGLATAVESPFTIPLTDLSPGVHTVYIRAKDEKGQWSQTISRQFVKRQGYSESATAPNTMEYFIDNDPGYGNGDNSPKSLVVPIADLPVGLHKIYFRAKDENGNWSATIKRDFVKLHNKKTIDPSLVLLEYYFDEDPGFGNGHSISLEEENQSIVFDIDLTPLDNGFHHLYIRGKDAAGNWSYQYHKPIIKRSVPKITKVHYYLDETPSEDNPGTVIEVTQTENPMTCEFTAELSGLEAGEHTIYIVAENENGIYSNVYSGEFTVAGSTGTEIPKLEKQIDVFPNPFSSSLQINIKEIEGLKWIKIVKSNGELIYTRTNMLDSKNNKVQIDTQSWPAGAYFIIISTSQGLYTETVIK
jgi:hypothetical protein